MTFIFGMFCGAIISLVSVGLLAILFSKAEKINKSITNTKLIDQEDQEFNNRCNIADAYIASLGLPKTDSYMKSRDLQRH